MSLCSHLFAVKWRLQQVLKCTPRRKYHAVLLYLKTYWSYFMVSFKHKFSDILYNIHLNCSNNVQCHILLDAEILFPRHTPVFVHQSFLLLFTTVANFLALMYKPIYFEHRPKKGIHSWPKQMNFVKTQKTVTIPPLQWCEIWLFLLKAVESLFMQPNLILLWLSSPPPPSVLRCLPRHTTQFRTPQ